MKQLRKLSLRRLWRNTSVGYKLYTLVGVMGFVVAAELLTLVFAMNTFSAVRAFVQAEGLWSKAQKDAVISLNEYARTGDPLHYSDFLEHIQVPLGDRRAVSELDKVPFDIGIVRDGFLVGRIHPDDIDGLMKLAKRFGEGNFLYHAFGVWQQGDTMIDQLIYAGEHLHTAVQQQNFAETQMQLKKINQLNTQLTRVEDEFSSILAQGSRHLEELLLYSLLAVVFVVEGLGLTLTISFARQLSGSLHELNQIAEKIRDGDYSQKAQVKSEDELGQLGEAINKMSQALDSSLSQQKRAELASQTKSQFLANMSHEIRTPVGAIVGFVDLLNDPSLTREEQKNYIDVIRRTGLVLTQIIDDILDLSKVEAGYVDVESSTVSLPRLLDDVESIVQTKCQYKSIKFIKRQEGFVPEMITTDPLRLRQILLNIIGNAAKFTNEGTIELTYRKEGTHLVFDVQDRGIGIAPEQIPLLFRPFSQVDSSFTRRHEGTGLGLVLSRRLAQLLGGDVQLVHSVVGEGSLFRIKVGFQAATTTMDPPNKKHSLPPAMRSLKGKNILVIDDNEDNLFLLNKILSKQGMNVTVASHGFEGIRLALSHHFDAIILDIQMPLMDGYTVAKKMRSNGLKMPIVALTAHAMKEDRIRCLNAGCNDYLSKPINVESLMKILDEQITPSHDQLKI